MHALIWIGGPAGVVFLGLLAWAVQRAPLGYEDRSGFHLGREPGARGPDGGAG